MTEVVAQVVLKLSDGTSILDMAEPVSAELVDRYRPSPEAVREATEKLEELGFSVGQPGASGITVTGEKSLFERVFRTRLESGPGRVTDMVYWKAEEPITIPDELERWVAGVTFAIEPVLMP